MGYTGAVFNQFFGNSLGIFMAFLILVFWMTLPIILFLRKLKKKDF